jgi:hypothetical protein
MENLDRIVADTLAQSGFETPVFLRPVPWSRWFRCETSFSLLLVPSAPGLYALAEEIAAPGEASAKRMLAVFDIGETDDLCVTLSRHFAPRSPLKERLSSGRCFVRFAQLRDAERRRIVCNSLKRWLAASAQTAAGLSSDISHDDVSTNDLGIARDFAKAETATPETAPARERSPLPADPPTASFVSSHNTTGPITAQASDHKTESRKAAAGDEPPPLPSGF